MKLIRRSQGAHMYRGKRFSRGSRYLSKMHRGLDSGDVEGAFEAVTKEKQIEQRQTNRPD